MYLQLAEDNDYVPPTIYMAENRYTNVKGYTRRRNRVPAHQRQLNEYGGFAGEELDNPYVFIPDPSGRSEGMMVREDYFDSLNDWEWRKLMVDILPFQPSVRQGMSEDFFLAAKEDRKAKREARKTKRAEKTAVKVDKKKAKNEIRKARATAKAEGRGSDVFGSVVGGLTNIFGKGGGGGEEPGGGGAPGAGGGGADDEDDKKILGMSYPVAGIVGAGVAFGLYKLLK